MTIQKRNLCYSVSEADRRFLRELTRVRSSGTNRRNEPHKQGFNSTCFLKLSTGLN